MKIRVSFGLSKSVKHCLTASKKKWFMGI